METVDNQTTSNKKQCFGLFTNSAKNGPTMQDTAILGTAMPSTAAVNRYPSLVNLVSRLMDCVNRLRSGVSNMAVRSVLSARGFGFNISAYSASDSHLLATISLLTIVNFIATTCSAIPFDALVTPPHSAFEQHLKVYSNELDTIAKQAIQGAHTLDVILNSKISDELIALIERYQSTERSRLKQLNSLTSQHSNDRLPLIRHQQLLHQRSFFKHQPAYLWPNQFNEYLALSKLLFSFQSAAFQQQHQSLFNESTVSVEAVSNHITTALLQVRPSAKTQPFTFSTPASRPKIIVFDVFSEQYLTKQRKFYPDAWIEAPVFFGEPLALEHGNAVIDVILQSLPFAHIIPVQAGAQQYQQAFDYIATLDALVVNLSRALPEANGQLDEIAVQSMNRVALKTPIIKALGNCGTDLEGKLAPRRVALGLGPVGGLSCYDTDLIKRLSELPATTKGLWLFAINGAYITADTALTATIPGANTLVQQRSFKIPAEGIFIDSLFSFESGSSFSAPQLSAAIAGLATTSIEKGPVSIECAIKALAASAKRETNAEEEGLGLLQIQPALHFLTNNDCQ
jgi:hypothetical protein